MQEEILNKGLAEQSLNTMEINLLQANKIDRKTLLLRNMEIYDRAQINQLGETETMQTKKVELENKIDQKPQITYRHDENDAMTQSQKDSAVNQEDFLIYVDNQIHETPTDLGGTILQSSLPASEEYVM